MLIGGTRRRKLPGPLEHHNPPRPGGFLLNWAEAGRGGGGEDGLRGMHVEAETGLSEPEPCERHPRRPGCSQTSALRVRRCCWRHSPVSTNPCRAPLSPARERSDWRKAFQSARRPNCRRPTPRGGSPPPASPGAGAPATPECARASTLPRSSDPYESCPADSITTTFRMTTTFCAFAS